MKRMNIIKTTGLVLASTLLVACSPNEEPADNVEQIVDGTASGIGNQEVVFSSSEEGILTGEHFEGELDVSQADYLFQEIHWSDNDIQNHGFESVNDLDQYVINSSVLLLEDLQTDGPDDLSRAVIEDYKDFTTLYAKKVAGDFDQYTDLDDSEKASIFTGHVAENYLFQIIYMTSLEMAVEASDNQEYSDFQELMLEVYSIGGEMDTALADIADKHGIEYN